MILIVDDRAENIFSLRRTLELNGFEVDTAGSGEEALKKVLRNNYSLIILDVQMPGMDGFEVADALSGYSKARDIPIIFLSAVNTEKKFITKGYTSGGVDYVAKPVDPDIFMLKVKTLHRLYEQNRELNNIRLALLDEVEERKRAETELNNRVDELKSILQALPQIAFTLLPDGTVDLTNKYWLEYAADSAGFLIFSEEDASKRQLVAESLKKGVPLEFEVRLLHIKSNAYRCHLFKLLPILQQGIVKKWVGTFTDIQEQKAANELLEVKVKERTEALENKNRELEASNYELQQFASVASHDLKEPLRKIQIFSSIINDRFLGESVEAKDKISRVIDASQRMTGLINDLLDYSRLSMKSLFQKTDIRNIILSILNDLEFSIEEKKANVIVGELPEAEVIPGQIRQVFQNLISNSLKFAHKDREPEINISGHIAEHDGILYSEISVADNGIGFNEKYLEKIFTIFQRLNAKEDYEGSGIGLAIVKKIIENHSGTISASSSEGVGATFILRLPVQQPAAHHVALEKSLAGNGEKTRDQ